MQNEKNESYEDLKRSKEMSDALNKVAAVFLSGLSDDHKTFEDMMTTGMGLIADMADLDRLNLWRNTMEPDGLHTSQIYRWDRESGGTTIPTAELMNISFAQFAPGWEDVLLHGESINSPARLLNEWDLLNSYGVMSVFITPIFIREEFWGFVLFSDHHNEHYFDEYCSEMLRSAAFLCANAVIRQEMEREIVRANKLNSSILESMPVGMAMFTGNPPTIVDCNQELTRMFNAPKKQIVDNYFEDFAPEYLRDGRVANIDALDIMRLAMGGEVVRTERLHQTADGEPVPCDLTLTSVEDEGGFIGLGFLYDLRHVKKMEQEMQRREQELVQAKELNEIQLNKMDLMAEATHIALWDMNASDEDDPSDLIETLVFSSEFRHMLGYEDEKDFPNVITSWSDLLHPDDKEATILALNNHIDDKTGETPFDVEYRLLKKNGEYSYFRATGATIRNKDGRAFRVAGALMDITKEKDLLFKMDKLRIEAEAASMQKSTFLANMSHEIRTPLNAVIGLSDLVLEIDELDDESRYRLEQINNAGETLLSTVNDILDISKIEAGKFELICSKYDIPSMINDAATQSIMHRGDKDIEFVMNICDDLPTHLYGDELRIKQVLNNLLSNAFKYTLEGLVELTIDCEREDDKTVWLCFTVHDTGMGIRQENVADLFNDYVQIDMSATRRIVGTGLGLSIAKRLADLMGGQIKVESEYGKGSVFSVRLRQKRVTDEIVGPAAIESLKNFHYSEQKRKRLGSMKRLSLPYARILLVDDVITNLDVAKGLMKPYHMQIDCVTGGFEAIEAMLDESIRYSAIFMDHMMPGMDGLEATRKIREIDSDYARNIPIIALTANAIVGNEEMFLSNGFQAFISKPIEISRLDTVLRTWVRDKELEKLYSRADDENGHSDPGDSDGSGGSGKVDQNMLRKIIPGLNPKRGLKRFGGDADAYVDVLRSFAINTPPLLDLAIEASKSKESLKDYETIVHGVKGSSRSICADEAADLAEALEDAAGDGDFYFIIANNATFIETTRVLISNIDALLEDIQANELKPKKDKPDVSTLLRLREACENYEMNIVDEAIAELESFSYESDGELVVWLRRNAEQTNFEEIVERLADV